MQDSFTESQKLDPPGHDSGQDPIMCGERVIQQLSRSDLGVAMR